jgi:PGF-pre-PGF domain-containing protein
VRIVAVETKEIPLIKGGETVKLQFTKTDITELVFTVKSLVRNVRIMIVKYGELPPDVPAVSGEIYSYFAVDVKNLDEGNIRDAEIKFKVEKEWGVEKIKLNRYSEGWNPLPTKKVGEGLPFPFHLSWYGTPGAWKILSQRLQHPLIVFHSKLVVFAPISLFYLLYPSPIMILAEAGYTLRSM